jgi:type II secretory ATPase GspE/PulE/Tfp pilus assembly ATPase PilB-like protein
MVLLTGPTGSGKSTTLHTAIKAIKSPRKNIITVEDPVEYRQPGIQQVQVKSEIGFDFARSLRSILRQDPDIIMVGEIRDQETAQIAVRAALTGHLVLSTLHTNDATSTVTRLINIGVEPFLVATAVTAAAQRSCGRSARRARKPTGRTPRSALFPDPAPRCSSSRQRVQGLPTWLLGADGPLRCSVNAGSGAWCWTRDGDTSGSVRRRRHDDAAPGGLPAARCRATPRGNRGGRGGPE